MPVTVPPIPTPVPQSTDPLNFDARADAMLSALPGVVTAQNAQNDENNTINTNVNALQVTATNAANSATNAANSATNSATSAASSASSASTQANAASTSAQNSQASANNAAGAVLSQLSAVKTQTEDARDQALAGLGAADNSQGLANLLGTLAYALDLAGQGISQQVVTNQTADAALAGLAAYDLTIEQTIYAIVDAVNLAGITARAISGGGILLSPGTQTPPPLSSAGDSGTGLMFPAVGQIAVVTNALERLRIDASGRVGIGTNAPSGMLDVADNKLRIRTAQTPASASASGSQGEIAWDAGFVYVCTATNTWRRAALASW
jgi:hypothetical protein